MWDEQKPDGSRGGGGSWEEGACQACNLVLCRTHSKGLPCVWASTNVEVSWLVERLKPEEVEAISKKMSNYQALGKRWVDMLARMKPEDQLWRFRNPRDGVTGIAVVRGSVPVADFNLVTTDL